VNRVVHLWSTGDGMGWGNLRLGLGLGMWADRDTGQRTLTKGTDRRSSQLSSVFSSFKSLHPRRSAYEPGSGMGRVGSCRTCW
jgi:hypothetical protein